MYTPHHSFPRLTLWFQPLHPAAPPQNPTEGDGIRAAWTGGLADEALLPSNKYSRVHKEGRTQMHKCDEMQRVTVPLTNRSCLGTLKEAGCALFRSAEEKQDICGDVDAA